MIELFDIKDKKPVPKAVCYLIPQLAKVIETFPEEHIKALAYIFFTTCFDSTNPYYHIEELQREQVVIADQQPFSFSLDDLVIIQAREKCRQLFETPMQRLVQGAKKMLEEMSDNLGQPLTFGKDGNATDMRGIMKEIRGYSEDYIKMEIAMKEEQSKVRGQLKLRYDFQPTYRNTKENNEEKDNL